MKAFDTNVLARFFVDDPDDSQAGRQRPAAVATLSARGSVSVTVLLEFEWVMRGFYDIGRSEIARVMKALCGIEHISIEDRRNVLNAIEAYDAGLDFADALHLARASQAAAFVTFDRNLAKRAATFGSRPPVELLK